MSWGDIAWFFAWWFWISWGVGLLCMQWIKRNGQ